MRLGSVRRLFADDFTAGGQLDWQAGRRGLGGHAWRDDLLGQLRFDVLVAETLVVSDVHLFDGPFFLATTPQALSQAIGRGRPDGEPVALPIEVRGRRQTLAASLADLLRRDGRDHLNAFSFKTVADKAVRAALADQLGRTPARALDRHLDAAPDAARAVTGVLRDRLVELGLRDRSDELLGPLERGWIAWLEGAEHVAVEAWPVHVPYDLPAALAAEPVEATRLVSDDGRAAHAEIMFELAKGSEHRSDINAAVAPLRAHAMATGNEQALRDVEMIDRWYSRARYRTLARQHQCRFAGSEDPTLPALSTSHAHRLDALAGRAKARRRIELPEGVLTRLADVDNDAFRRLVFDHRRELSEWWNTGDVDQLERVTDRLAAMAPAPSRRALALTELVGEIPKVASGAAAGGAALAAGAGSAVALTAGLVMSSAGVLASRAVKAGRDQGAMQRRVIDAWQTRAGDSDL